MRNTLSIDNKILKISRCDYKYFFSKKNVIGVGLGFKIKKGFLINKKCIKVFVRNKLKNNQLNINDVIPKYYKGIVTDVVKGDNVYSSSFTNRIRPVPGGYSIGTSLELSSGTMACLVTDGKSYYVLSNSHILNPRGLLPLTTEIIQPGKRDYGKAPEDVIALLSKYIPIKINTKSQVFENFVDCAMAKITKRSAVYTKIALIGHIKGVTPPKLNIDVQKVGRISELTKGKIMATGVTQLVNYINGQALFKDLIVTTSMSQDGDSGALLLDMNNYAIGLLFSGSQTNSYFNPIQTVLDNLNVSLVTRN